MDMLKEFFRDKSPPRLLLIAATLLVFISQFFYYFDDPDRSLLDPGSGYRESRLYLDLDSKGIVTGWEVHPHAYWILIVLTFALLRDDVADSKWFIRLGYWAALILIVMATSPGAPLRATGAGMGAIAWLMALAAALMNLLPRRSAPPPLK